MTVQETNQGLESFSENYIVRTTQKSSSKTLHLLFCIGVHSNCINLQDDGSTMTSCFPPHCCHTLANGIIAYHHVCHLRLFQRCGRFQSAVFDHGSKSVRIAQGRVPELAFVLDEIVISLSDWAHRKIKKGLIHAAMFDQTTCHGVSRNVKHISLIVCVSAAGESLIPCRMRW
jgi:hypothetical protein